jgi:hypothetical protein
MLTKEQYQTGAKPILKQVFAIDDSEDVSFTQNISARRILYHNLDYYLGSALIDAVIRAAQKLNDSGCYISLLDTFTHQSSHCYIPLSEFSEAYNKGGLQHQLGMDFWSDYVIYSSQAKWGILMTSARYGLIGGSLEFIEEIEADLPDLSEQVHAFIKHWKAEETYALSRYGDRSINTWIPDLLTHVYGSAIAKSLWNSREISKD